jgi:hypothetical protein
MTLSELLAVAAKQGWQAPDHRTSLNGVTVVQLHTGSRKSPVTYVGTGLKVDDAADAAWKNYQAFSGVT